MFSDLSSVQVSWKSVREFLFEPCSDNNMYYAVTLIITEHIEYFLCVLLICYSYYSVNSVNSTFTRFSLFAVLTGSEWEMI